MVRREKIAIQLIILYSIILAVEIIKGLNWVFIPEDRKILYSLQYIADSAMILLQMITFSIWELIDKYYFVKNKIKRIYKIIKIYVAFIGIIFPSHFIYCLFFKDVRLSEFLFYSEVSMSLLVFTNIYLIMNEKPYFILLLLPAIIFLSPSKFPIFVLIPFTYFVVKSLEIIPVKNLKNYYIICLLNIILAIFNKIIGVIFGFLLYFLQFIKT